MLTLNNKYNLQKLASTLISARHKIGLTQEEIALSAELNTSVIARYESGKANPTLLTLLKLEKAYKVDLILI